MSQIKSLEALKALRDQHKDTIEARSDSSESKIRIAVGMATCGIAAGARDTVNAMIDELRGQGIKNAAVIQTGCMGYCYAEPIVEVRIPGQPPVLYGKVNAARGRELIQKHVKGGEVQKAWLLERVEGQNE